MSSCRLSDGARPASGDQVPDHHNQRDDEEQVDEPSPYEHNEEAEGPKTSRMMAMVQSIAVSLLHESAVTHGQRCSFASLHSWRISSGSRKKGSEQEAFQAQQLMAPSLAAQDSGRALRSSRAAWKELMSPQARSIIYCTR